MDIVHHALIGGAGMLVAVIQDQPLVGFAFIAGSVFPDLDVIFMVLGKRFYLKHHQGITHSVILAPLYALLLSMVILMPLGEWWQVEVYLAVLAGLYIHVLLDWFNTYRIALLSPFIKKRYSLDAVFFIDSVALALTALFYVLHAFDEVNIAIWLYPGAFAVYFLSKLAYQRKVRRQLDALFAIPSSLNPFEFYVLVEDEQGLLAYIYNGLTGNKKKQIRYEAEDEAVRVLAEKSRVYQDMKDITRAFYITGVDKTENGVCIQVNDIAVRNFGGKFARTTLEFDNNGKLIREVANI
ncbi:MAG: metal-dependent hydrolase [Gammaproteobacteria bacterium]|nr:metal-dependent hydrolase [Gammaproteobacteria bacterium]